MQVPAPEVEYFPEAQVEHVLDPASANVPGTQIAGVELPVHDLPSGQGTQVDIPMSGA